MLEKLARAKPAAVNPMNEKKPILVTGAHRSGTTWVGKMIAASSEVAYISEPLNVHHRPGVLRVPTQYWYTYICEENQVEFLPALQDTTRFRYHLWLELKSLRSTKDIGRLLRDLSWFISGRVRGARALLKDPFAVFSAPWFAEVLDCRVVILVRHPLAFVSSLKRLGWDFDFRDLFAQPLLMQDHLESFRGEMEASLENPEDIIAQGSLLWRIVYTVMDRFREMHPEFLVVRHEDLSHQPESGFHQLYTALGLAFSQRVQQTLANSSQSDNPEELSKRKVHAVNLNSRANLSNWKKRLTDEEILRIRKLTTDIAEKFYPEEFWEKI
jgi:hypothetical protein